MKRKGLAVLSSLAAAALMASPIAAHSKKPVHHGATCKQIKDAMASGKSAEDVAKDLKTSASRVKSCTAPAPAHHRAKKKTAS